jgi:type I restriction enzyme, S subunit
MESMHSPRWSTKTLADCIEKVKVPAKIPRTSFLDEGSFPVISQEADFINGYWNDEADLVKPAEPVVIFGDHTQVLKLIDFDFVVGADGVKILKPKHFLDAKFLRFYLEANPFPSLGYARHYRHISALEVPLPQLDEQKRIVAVLDQAFAALDRARAHAEANLADARSLFVEIIRERFASDVIEFGSVELRELAEHITDGDHQPPPKIDVGVPFVTISNIDKVSRSIDFSDTFYVSNEYFQRLSDKRRARRGDVLYTVTGSFGIPVLVNEAYGDFCFQRHIGLIRTKSSVDPKWLYYMLLSPQIFEQADKGATGTAQRTVSLRLLRGLRVAKAPQSRQKIVAVELDELWERCKALSSKYAKAVTDITNLRHSLLQKAFSGRL